jgi:FMN phosphatase YigB (HAD superfamily)
MNNAGVKPEECLFVGDNYYDDILGSRKVKMQSILINPYDNKGIEELTNIDTISNISKLPQYIETKYKFKLF